VEQITTAALAKFLWDTLGQPVLNKAKEQYSEIALDKLDNVLSRIGFNGKEQKLIKSEIENADLEIWTDERRFLEFIQKNKQINEILVRVNKRETNININVTKGVGCIYTMNGDINF
jgi:hypothetical protein